MPRWPSIPAQRNWYLFKMLLPRVTQKNPATWARRSQQHEAWDSVLTPDGLCNAEMCSHLTEVILEMCSHLTGSYPRVEGILVTPSSGITWYALMAQSENG